MSNSPIQWPSPFISLFGLFISSGTSFEVLFLSHLYNKYWCSALLLLFDHHDKAQRKQSLGPWSITWKHKVTPCVGKAGAQQSVPKILTYLAFLFRCAVLPKGLWKISENETTVSTGCEMKGSSFPWLEEMPYNKVSLCQQCLAAASENKAMLCWVLTGKHPIKLNKMNKQCEKGSVSSLILSWKAEKEALLWKAAQGTKPRCSSSSSCSLQPRATQKQKPLLIFLWTSRWFSKTERFERKEFLKRSFQQGGAAIKYPLVTMGVFASPELILPVQ